MGTVAPIGKASETKPNNPAAQLRSLVDRIVRLTEEKVGLAADIREIFAEAKSNGWDVKALRVVVKRAMEDAEKREAREATEMTVEAMMASLGEFANSPLGQAAVRGVGH